jgi:hypothetical protein
MLVKLNFNGDKPMKNTILALAALLTFVVVPVQAAESKACKTCCKDKCAECCKGECGSCCKK